MLLPGTNHFIPGELCCPASNMRRASSIANNLLYDQLESPEEDDSYLYDFCIKK